MANKVDLEEMRQVSSEEIQMLVDREKLIYVGECSALSDTNIKPSFETLIRKIHATQEVQKQKQFVNALKLNQKYTSNNQGSTCGSQSWCCTSGF
jgi:GTPase SAR1 family protein